MQKILVVLSLLVVMLFVPTLAFAENNHTPVVLPKSETVDHNYFATGSSIDVEGTVNGDAYLAGGTILMNGTIHGDLLTAGGQITMKGTVNNMRVAGGQVIIDGKVNGNVTVAGGSITLASGSVVAGSVVGAGGEVLVNGPVGKTITIGGGQVTLGSTIGSDVSLAVGQITLTPDATIHGNLWYQSQGKAQIDKGATVTGSITHALPPQQEQKPASFAGIALVASLIMLLIEFVIGALLLALLPIYSKRVLETIQERFLLSLGVGILAWILTPILVVLLLITLIGIPFAIVVLLAVVISSYLGKIYAALFIGNWLLGFFNKDSKKKQINMFLALLVGLILFDIIGWIPILGWLFVILLNAVGFGATLMVDRNLYIDLRGKKLI